MASKIQQSYDLELIPRDPPAIMPGLVLVGNVVVVNGPNFVIECEFPDRLELSEFRADENEELAVRVSDGSTWEIGRSAYPG